MLQSKSKKILVLLFFLVGLIGGAFFVQEDILGNTHCVIPNQIYRSAQMNQSALLLAKKEWHIKSILNLRGEHLRDDWWIVEHHFATHYLLNYVSLRFSAGGVPTKAQLLSLVSLLETMPKPLLLHCQQGADRSGLASALSVILFTEHPKKHAIEAEVSWRYGVLSPHSVGYEVIQNYFSWLQQEHLAISKESWMAFLQSPEPMKLYFGWFF